MKSGWEARMTAIAHADSTPADMFDVSGRSIVITGATGALGGPRPGVLPRAVRAHPGGRGRRWPGTPEGGAWRRRGHRGPPPGGPGGRGSHRRRSGQTFGRLDGLVVASGMNHVAPSST